MFQLETDRLRLIPLPPFALRLLLLDRAAMEDRLDLKPSGMQIPESFQDKMPDAMQWWATETEAHPDHWMWFTNWEVVLQEENRSIGGCGYAGLPNEHGQVFIGYWMDPRFHGQGYMTEAVEALARWAFEHPMVREVAANTPADNLASQRVLAKNGFVRRGFQEGHPFWVLPRPELLDLSDTV
jgi:[ribosomal protein S5]-alanine N-acetyltransferase